MGPLKDKRILYTQALNVAVTRKHTLDSQVSSMVYTYTEHSTITLDVWVLILLLVCFTHDFPCTCIVHVHVLPLKILKLGSLPTALGGLSSAIYIVVAVHSQDSMRLACANAVLAVHCNYFVGSS